MSTTELNPTEQTRRKHIVEEARNMINAQFSIDEQDETSVMTSYRDYYLQISFSDMHPLMVFCLAKRIKNPTSKRQKQMANELNLKSILGSHAINDKVGCYSYRATHWLDTEIDASRFFEILNRCVDEADRGYFKLAS